MMDEGSMCVTMPALLNMVKHPAIAKKKKWGSMAPIPEYGSKHWFGTEWHNRSCKGLAHWWSNKSAEHWGLSGLLLVSLRCSSFDDGWGQHVCDNACSSQHGQTPCHCKKKKWGSMAPIPEYGSKHWFGTEWHNRSCKGLALRAVWTTPGYVEVLKLWWWMRAACLWQCLLFSTWSNSLPLQKKRNEVPWHPYLNIAASIGLEQSGTTGVARV